MKMKKACETTALTERAIRLYISKGLITPRQVNGLIDFAPEDVQLLRDIALMRQMDFSMEQIAGLISGADIPSILAARWETALAGAERESAVASALNDLEMEKMTGLHALADSIRARSVTPSLNFTQLDEIDEETRRLEARVASRETDHQHKRQRILHRLGWTAAVIILLLAAAQFFLSRTRIEGYLPLSPITVTAVQGDRATFQTGNAKAAGILGRDVFTMPYRVDGFNTETRDKWGRPAVAEGETIEHACLLKIRLTWGDLLRLGINPLQDFDPPSVLRHNEWMTLILRAVLEDGESGDCILMLREHPGTKPLLWEEQ